MFLPDCAVDIAEFYDVPIELVAAVKYAESGSRGQKVGRIGPNRNGTYDLGAMQINTWWLTKASPEYRLSNWGIDEAELLQNECTNIAVGTWILSQNLNRYGNTRAALAAYNTGSPSSNVGLRYADRIMNRMESHHESRHASNN